MHSSAQECRLNMVIVTEYNGVEQKVARKIVILSSRTVHAYFQRIPSRRSVHIDLSFLALSTDLCKWDICLGVKEYSYTLWIIML